MSDMFKGKYVEVKRNTDGSTSRVEKDFENKAEFDAFMNGRGTNHFSDFDSMFKGFNDSFASFGKLMDGPFKNAFDSFRGAFEEIRSPREDELDLVRKHERELALEKAKREEEKKRQEEEKRANEEELSKLKKSIDILEKYEKEWKALGNEEKVSEIRNDLENVRKRIDVLSKK